MEDSNPRSTPNFPTYICFSLWDWSQKCAPWLQIALGWKIIVKGWFPIVCNSSSWAVVLNPMSKRVMVPAREKPPPGLETGGEEMVRKGQVKNEGETDEVRGGGKKRAKIRSERPLYWWRWNWKELSTALPHSLQWLHWASETGVGRPVSTRAGLLSQLRAACSTSGGHKQTHHSSWRLANAPQNSPNGSRHFFLYIVQNVLSRKGQLCCWHLWDVLLGLPSLKHYFLLQWNL